MSRTVLVTRSEPGASETARRLEALGYRAVVEPLLSVEAIDAYLPDFDALAFTSANGVRRFVELSGRRDLPVWCVGDRTAAEATKAGFENVRSAAGAVTDLIDTLRHELPRDVELLHSGNEAAGDDLAGALRQAGMTARFVATYRTREAAAAGPALSSCLETGCGIDCILVHSPKASGILARLIGENPQKPVPPIASISANASAKLLELGLIVETAGSPDEDALFRALETLVGQR